MAKIFQPSFLKQYRKGQIKSDSDAGKRSLISKRNTSTFYTTLYRTLFGGKLGPQFKGNYEIMQNGNKINFHPDITKKTKNEINYTEVKTNSTRTSHPYIPKKQLENYFYHLITNLTNGEKSSEVDYSFFRYGDSYLVRTHLLSNSKLIKILSLRTRDLLTLPINALFFMTQLPGSRKENMNQSTSKGSDNNVPHWQLPGRYLNLAHKEELFSQNSNPELEDLLFIDQLEVKHSTSPRELFSIGYKGGEYKVAQFPITTYSIAESARTDWINHLKKNHEEIAKVVGIRDLYQEEQSRFPWELEDERGLSEEEHDKLLGIK